jgi:RING finger protein 121
MYPCLPEDAARWRTRTEVSLRECPQVYTFFLGVYRVSKVLGVTGYCLVLA